MHRTYKSHGVNAVHLYYSHIACGQIVKNVFICDEMKNTLCKSGIPKKKLDRINNVTVENFTSKDLQLISDSLRKYTNAYQNKIGAKAPMGPIIKGLLTSPDYKMKDFKAILPLNNISWCNIPHYKILEIR